MIIYVTEDDRKRLLELREQIATTENREAISKEIADIESRKKTLLECSLDELHDLRNQYSTRMMMMRNIGSNIRPYEVAINTINQRIMVVGAKAAMETKKEPKRVERPTTTNTDNYDWSVEFGKYGK